MRKISFSTKHPQLAVRTLKKLLTAADTAQREGKHLALDRVLKEAKKLSDYIKESQAQPFKVSDSYDSKKTLAELQWLKYQGARKIPPSKLEESSELKDSIPYKKVTGIIVE